MRGIVDIMCGNRFNRLLFAVMALGFLTMPVEYRGGASIAHPHALYQFWVEVAHGTMDHHDHGADPTLTMSKDAGPIGKSTSDEPTATGLMQPGAWLLALSVAVALLFVVPGPGASPMSRSMSLRGEHHPSPAVPPP